MEPQPPAPPAVAPAPPPAPVAPVPPVPSPDRSGGDPVRSGSPGPAAELDLDAVTADLAAVEEALGRLDDGRYGCCAACDGPISDERLAAEPTATTCAAHARP